MSQVIAVLNYYTTPDEHLPSCDFWDQEDEEVLRYTGLDEAIENIIANEELTSGTMTVRGFCRTSPETIRKHHLPSARDVVDWLIERAGDELANPDGEENEPTAEALQAAEELLRLVAQDYVSWRCEPVVAVDVDVARWLADHQEKMDE